MQVGRSAIVGSVVFAALALARPAHADGQTSLMYVDPNDPITEVSASTPTGVEHYLYLQEKVDPNGSNVVCRNYVLTVYTIQLNCYADDLCLHEWATDPTYVVRRICTSRTPPPQGPQMQTDTTGLLTQVLQLQQFEVADVSAMPTPASRTVAFGFAASPRFALPSAGGGSCPSGTVLLSSPLLLGLGSKNLCVETTPLINNATVESQVDLALQAVTSDAGNADSEFPWIVSILKAALGQLSVAVACRTDDLGALLVCLRHTGHVDLPQSLSLGRGFCPVEPDESQISACEARGEQVSFGCSAIACIDALNRLGMAGCELAVGTPLAPLLGGQAATVANTVCELIRKRDHYYTVPATGVPLTVCTTADGPRCNASFVTQKLLADVRNQAPQVLQGPPSYDTPAPLLTQVRAIQDGAIYFLGNPQIDLSLIHFGLTPNVTSNPIRISAPYSDPQCSAAAANVTRADHPLEGSVSSCITQQGSAVTSLIIGRGMNTRLALFNELLGPWMLSGPQGRLRTAVQAALGHDTGPPCNGGTCRR